MKRFRAGYYTYKGYKVRNHGYHAPDKCVWWEAINKLTNEADYHAGTKREIRELIDGGK